MNSQWKKLYAPVAALGVLAVAGAPAMAQDSGDGLSEV